MNRRDYFPQRNWLFGVLAIGFVNAPCIAQQPPQADKAVAFARALNVQTQCDFIELPLDNACEFFQEIHGLQPIEIDKAALKELELSEQSPCTVTIRYVPLFAALSRILHNISPELDVTPRDGWLVITSAKNSWCTVRYDVRELAEAALKSKSPAEEGQSEAAAIRELIVNLVAPESWKEAGGKGVINVEGNELIVQNVARSQWEVRSLLLQLQNNLVPAKGPKARTVGDKIRLQAEEMFRRGDKNGDGTVSGDEYESMRDRDLNADQKITQDECLEYLRKYSSLQDRRR